MGKAGRLHRARRRRQQGPQVGVRSGRRAGRRRGLHRLRRGGAVEHRARQVAAACAKLGLECHLGIMQGRPMRTEPGYAETGNILLDRLFGAIIHDIPWDEDRNRRLREIAGHLKAAGRRPYLVPYGASDALGAMGYALAADEIVHDCPNAAWIVHGSGSAGTQAGLLAGLLALGHPARVIGVDVDAQPERVHADVCRVGRAAAALLGVEALWRDDRVEVAAAWSGGAYGLADRTTEEAIRLAARTEGFALDPVYAGKGMAGLIGLARQGRFPADDHVVWIHTGGVPGIFAYPETMARLSAPT
ncbi:MAG: pyridoxal-phosphate dependent enzyme [Rhodospirillales bacterium]|nr:pyridoxal-phosphate dependent enzyme [Rhodospirillales bacterium]